MVSHGFPMVSPWFPQGFPRVSPWFPHPQDTSHERFDHWKRPGAGGAAAGLVSRDFMSSLSAEVGHDPVMDSINKW